jgi:hypothetical protein
LSNSGSGQLAGFVEDVLRHGKLAGVVQQRRRLDRLDLLFRIDAERVSETNRVGLHPPNVTVGHIVFGVDRHGESFDRGEVEPIEIAEMALRIFEPAKRRTQRQVEHRQQRQAPSLSPPR